MADQTSLDLVSGQRWRRAALPVQLQVGLVSSRAVTSGLGLLLIGVADYRARHGMEPSELFFWLGLVVLVVPIALSLWSHEASRTERLGLAMLLGVGLWGARLLYDPTGLIYFDEFSHWRTAIDIAGTGRLFTTNPLQAISAYYPGLEGVTAMFAALSGLPLDIAGLLVVLIGRVVLVLGLFVFFERVAGSARAAGLAILVYVSNQSFLFFDAQFSYESFALGLAAMALAALALRMEAQNGRPFVLLAGAAIAATVVTHHLTSYALVVVIALWAIAGPLRRADRLASPPLLLALFGVVAAAGWLIFVAATTVDYLEPHILGGAEQLVGLITGEATSRHLFEDPSGVQASLVEKAVAYGSVLLILAALPLGLLAVWQRQRRQPAALALAVVVLAFPLSLVGRLTAEGAEGAARLSAFVFLGVAYVIGLWGSALAIPTLAVGRRAFLGAASAVVFAGGVILGIPPWARMPYPYRVAADPRSINAESIAAALWVDAQLGAHQAIMADRTNRQILGTYGNQDPLKTGRGANILLSPSLATARRLIAEFNVDYVLVDDRLSEAVPLVGNYVFTGELGGIHYTKPVDEATLTKLDSLQGASRIFDSGHIQIYDVRGVR